MQPYQILLAEDSAGDVGIIRMALRDLGIDHVLHVVPDGAEAIAFIENADRARNSPCLHLLLLDMHLPKYDGEAVLKRLRSTEFCAQTPVIVLTSSAAADDYQRMQKQAALFYFGKPSSLDELERLRVTVRGILLKETSSSQS